MIRNLKALGFAPVVVFALLILSASTATAQQGAFTIESGSATGVATETGAFQNRITMFGTNVECPGTTYKVERVFLGGPVISGATEITVTPTYANCSGPFGWPTTIDMNGCDFVARLGETTGGVAGTYALTFSVVCPIGQSIYITEWTNNFDHVAGNTKVCVVEIPARTSLPGAHATDTGNGHIDITGQITFLKGVKITQGHGILCPSQETAGGSIDIDVTVKGSGGQNFAISHL